ncbi:NUDIX domain-containing protein [Gracilibacillus alcaliphilus]|uniref:NUDIX domain-containing protein n=1 Tax=Gracilibacillus alcaliphilus TaxID=1401441 RepID=UPI00195C3B0E|nr:NUDIX domain-containing protein [Gracilibacillus alcaliphilus]MBM7677881.1 8-oxo-dGTP pyrophosphatase MutT (NUDIX family) [Gracilibacillus alcaliphilus]
MAISNYYKNIRNKLGSDLILMPSVAAIIRNQDDHILFQYPKGSDFWSLPAGAIEPGETPAQAVIREVYEETALTIRPDHLLGVFGGEDFRFTYPNGDQVEYNIFVFACTIISGELSLNDDESVQLRFYPEESKPALALPYPDFIFTKQAASEVFFQQP